MTAEFFTGNATPATVATWMVDNKGTDITVTLVDGTVITGAALSVNSKGINVIIDGATKSVSLKKTVSLAVVTDDDDELDEDEIADLIEAGELDPMDDDDATDEGDGFTTAEVADMFNMAAKELRVHLRAMGMGVGQGSRYGLSSDDVRTIRKYLTTQATADNA